MKNDLEKWLTPCLALVREVGQAITPFFNATRSLDVRMKSDNTPLTQADLRAHEILQSGLSQISTYPVLSEEGKLLPFSERKRWLDYWLVDPIDGTRAFIRGAKDFTVNIALMHNAVPVMGVIYAPMLDVCYYALRGVGAYVVRADASPQRIETRPIDWGALEVVIGHYHNPRRLEALLAQWPGSRLHRFNSSLKFGLLASGEMDVYPRVGPTSEWDTAAGQCILEAAGGIVVDLYGKPLQYNAAESLRNPSFLALGDAQYLDKFLTVFQSERSVL